ncbi:MAG: class I SAM-dependent methyltransferase [SAR324 cluster bacterium]|nr:class I SAM-dependent methyltransferase [SAR324 cluster bacterium]
MKTQPYLETARYDDPEMYADSAGLRQNSDARWALGLLPEHRFRYSLDVGCGNGDFLAELLRTERVSKRVAGIDRSQAMVDSARRKLELLAGSLELRLERVDVLEFPSVSDTFDLVTMMAVLHWLYPEEARVFAWIAEQLERDGIFCLTTYHPTVDNRSRGGSDDVALTAMALVGGPTEFPDGFLPMGRRARSASEVELLLGKFFRIGEVHSRAAVTRVTDSQQYIRFHQGTFGSYYSQLLPSDRQASFLEAIGEVALDRMKEFNYVTSMEVRCWICLPRPAG